MTMPAEDRVAVYIDGSNIYHSLRTVANRTSLDFLAFARKLAGGRRLHRIYYYNALIDQVREPDRYREQQRFLHALQRVDYVEVRLGRLIYREGTPAAPYEKGIDIKIATDMLVHGVRRNYDVAVLVSGDTDFGDALQAIKDLGLHVEVALLRGAGSSRVLRDIADRVVEVDQSFLGDCWLG